MVGFKLEHTWGELTNGRTDGRRLCVVLLIDMTGNHTIDVLYITQSMLTVVTCIANRLIEQVAYFWCRYSYVLQAAKWNQMYVGKLRYTLTGKNFKTAMSGLFVTFIKSHFLGNFFVSYFVSWRGYFTQLYAGCQGSIHVSADFV